MNLSTSLALLALAAPVPTQQIDRDGTTHEQIPTCLSTMRDQATGNCVGVSSVPMTGMLLPLGAELDFDPAGRFRVGRDTIIDGHVDLDSLNADTIDVYGTLTILANGRIGIGLGAQNADLHIRRTGSATLLLEADINNSNEFSHPRITFRQDGGGVGALVGYENGNNNFKIRAQNDSDMLFQLPSSGTADWEYHHVNSFGNTLNHLGRLTQSGDWYIDGDYFSGGADLAEYYPVRGPVEPGDVVAFLGEGLALERAVSGSRARLAGIVSSDPGVVLGLSYTDEDETGENPEDLLVDDRLVATPAGHVLDRLILHEIEVNRRAPLALTGRVPCKVTSENGAIEPGDLLTVASIPGHAMKATESGAVLGTALEGWQAGEGTILVLANLGWFSPTEDLERRVEELEARLAKLERR